MWYIIVYSILSKTLLHYLVTKGISLISRYTCKFTHLARTKNFRPIYYRSYDRNIIVPVITVYIYARDDIIINRGMILQSIDDFIFYSLSKRYFLFAQLNERQRYLGIGRSRSFYCARKIATIRVFPF